MNRVDVPMMKFILYSAVTADSISDNLGMPEYSYYFVLKGLRPLLEELGEVELVEDPLREVDPIYHRCCELGQPCVFVSCSPPQKTALGLDCPTVSVFAWEFNNIPYESWDGDPRNDWRYVFAQHGRAISLSSHTANVVKATMGRDFDIVAVPVPVWDQFQHIPEMDSAGGKRSLGIDGNLVDTKNYAITSKSIVLHDALSQFDFPRWEGEELDMGYTLNDSFNSYLGGFYPAENWGAWSKTDQPWVLVPRILHGEVRVTLDCAGYGPSAGREIGVAIGDQIQRMVPGGDYSEVVLNFTLDKPEIMIRFVDLVYAPVASPGENRALALGLRRIKISSPSGKASEPDVAHETARLKSFEASGVVYTSIFNPVDGRKNWTEIVSAFCFAFRDVEDATLILKMTQKSMTSFLGRLHHLLHLLSPFKCRIIALHGFLEQQDYQRLVGMTSYYVGASGGEGLCLPMMEYMSAGKPAISTRNTAMEDYVDLQTSFIVDSSLEPSYWPHDPRKRLRTMRHRINWESLVSAFSESYEVAKTDQPRYQLMSSRARDNLRQFASGESVKARLEAFFLEGGSASQGTVHDE